jgi:hypothetical protein
MSPTCGWRCGVGCDDEEGGKELLFSIAVYLKDAVVWEWGNVSRALYRLRVWKAVMGMVAILQG